MSSRAAKLAELKAARSGSSSRASQWKASAKEDVYDKVSEADYDALVRKRLEQDDFIEDDDGGGYADDGREDWSGDDERRAADDSEDEHEREDRKKAKKAKKAAAAKKRPPPRALPVPTADAYRPKISAAKEDDFMASLLGGMTAAPEKAKQPRSLPSAPPMRKRRSSPPPALDRRDGKKSRVSFVKDEEPDEGAVGIDSLLRRGSAAAVKDEAGDFGMEMMGSPEWPASEGEGDDVDELKLPAAATARKAKGKAAASDDESDDEMGVQAKRRVAAPASAASATKRVNATSIKAKTVAVKALSDDDVEMAEPASTTPAWLSLADSLMQASTPPMPSSDDVRSSPPPPSAAARKREADGPATTSIEAFIPPGVVDDDDDLASGGTLRMFWLDFFEHEIKTDDGPIKQLYLIGKVWDRAGRSGSRDGKPGKWVSCCLKIDGLERNLFVCPRERTQIKGQQTDMIPDQRDIYSEFDQKRREHGVGSWMGKWVKRNYAFGVEGIPNGESDYLKVIYGFDQPPLPANLHGNTFGHVLGTNTSPFEIFVIKRKIMGPCWLEIKECRVSDRGMSWCKLECIVDDPKNVRPMSSDEDGAKETPPLTVMSIAARTIVNHKENTREIVCATARVWESANIDDPTPPEKQPSSIHTVVRPLGEWPAGFTQRAKSERSKIVTAANEAMLLSNFLVNISKHDPDVIVGHDFLNVSGEVLLQRMSKHKTRDWSKLGRIKRKGNAPVSNRFNGVLNTMTGRLVNDLTSDGAKTMISSTTWSLTEMCQSQLKISREDIDTDDTHTFFDSIVSSPERLLRFVRHCEVDAFFQMAIAAKVQILPLTKQLTVLSGNSWNRTLNGGRAERNEYILLHEFHRLKYICPDKFTGKNKAAILKAEAEDGDGAATATTGKRDKFKGGLVFEPKRGLWDKFVLVMDFNSLYPSIIQEYNIDFTTVSVTTEEDADGDEKIPEVPQSGVQQGVLPRLIAQLVGRRREVKGLMKGKTSPMLMMQYDIRQKALKLTANSMYGCLGFEYSRFYARPLAALTTFKGREILTSTKELAESIQLDVVYGDTDSVFVNSNVTDYKEAMVIANTFKKLVNDKYRLLEIDLDGVFQRVLLLQKKKYAALKVEADGSTSTEIKGLDMKRREFCALSKTVSQYVLEQVLSGEPTEVCIEKIHDYLTTVGEKVKAGKVDVDDFIINKRLGKNPEDYPDAKSQPQVQVALRIKARGGSARVGDVMQYVFCLGPDGKTSRSASADKAYTVDEIKKDPELKIDYEHYLSSQILPPIERLCDTIEGTDRARLAECLGLNPDRYSTKTAGDIERDFQSLSSKITDEERFADATKLNVRCFRCGSARAFGGIQDDLNEHIQPAGLACPTCKASLATPSVMVQLENQIRQHVSRYYDATMSCDDSSCPIGSTRAMGVYPKRCMAPGCKGQMSLNYTDSALYNQLLYYKSLFDGEKAVAAAKGTPREDELVALAGQNKLVLDELAAVVQKYLDRNGRGSVDMASLFSWMTASSASAWAVAARPA